MLFRSRLNDSANVISSQMYPSIIRSRARFDYDQVQSFFDGTAEYPDECSKVELCELRDLSKELYDKRMAMGAIDFDSVEPKLIFAEDGSVEDIRLRRRNDATGAIEEAMILANETVARYMENKLAPMVYRVHEAPSLEQMAALMPLLKELGYPTKGLSDLDPHAVQAVLEMAANRPEKSLVMTKVLRSMKRAVYRRENLGHYGLATDAYTHFTSPIRRYPDLIVHRLLRACMAGFFDDAGDYSETCARKSGLWGNDALKGIASLVSELDWLCEHCSDTERVAAEVEENSVQIKLCEYMERFVGDTFSGIITGVSSAGLYVTLPTTVKGLVRIQTLGQEYFVYDSEYQTLTGENSGIVYAIGAQVEVCLKSVSKCDITIDFELA